MASTVKLEKKYILLKLVAGLLVSVTYSPAIASSEISQKGMELVFCNKSQDRLEISIVKLIEKHDRERCRTEL